MSFDVTRAAHPLHRRSGGGGSMSDRGGRNEEATTAPVQVVVTALEACEATRSNGRQHPSHRALLLSSNTTFMPCLSHQL